MSRRTPTLVMVSLLVAALTTACGGGDDDVDSDSGPDVIDADVNAIDAPPGTPDAPPAPTVDAPFVPGPDAEPDACNFIANSANQITIRRLMQNPPTPLGGTIADGTYLLISDDFYLPDMMGMDLGTARGTIQISGTTMEQVHAQDVGDETRSTSDFVTNQSNITFTQSCPTVNDLSWDFYTATPTSFAIQYEVSSNPLVVRVRAYHRIP